MKKGRLDKLLGAVKVITQALTPLRDEERHRALRWATDNLGINLGTTQAAPGAPPGAVVPAPQSGQPAGATPQSAPGTTPTPKDFMEQKQPKTDAERITCLAYYLTHHRNLRAFAPKDLTRLNDDAHGDTFSNPSMACINAERQNRFLASAGRGKKRITTRGEALVKALPDREVVKTSLSTRPVRKRKRRKAAKSAR